MLPLLLPPMLSRAGSMTWYAAWIRLLTTIGSIKWLSHRDRSAGASMLL
jgi:hypothetical protein